jgi:hypothetical protein
MPTPRKTAAKAEKPQEPAGAPETGSAPVDTNPSPNGWEEPARTPDGADPLLAALRQLRAEFPAEAIGKLPKSTCRACADLAKARRYQACESHSWVRQCGDCGNSHSSATIHLDFVGHADATARLLDVDPRWTWRPFSLEEIQALPPALRDAGLWIHLTVAGVTRPGFGDAQGKTGPNAVKEMIGDALRNAAMRFGVSLDLWAKGDRERFHAKDETPESQVPDTTATQGNGNQVADGERGSLQDRHVHTRHLALDEMTRDQMPPPDRRRWDTWMGTFTDDWSALPEAVQAKVKATWPEGMPTPSSGRMTITQIQGAREHMAALLAEHLAAEAEPKAPEAQQDTLTGDGYDEPPC